MVNAESEIEGLADVSTTGDAWLGGDAEPVLNADQTSSVRESWDDGLVPKARRRAQAWPWC